MSICARPGVCVQTRSQHEQKLVQPLADFQVFAGRQKKKKRKFGEITKQGLSFPQKKAVTSIELECSSGDAPLRDKYDITEPTSLHIQLFWGQIARPVNVALWSSGKHLASGSGGPGFESWLCQVNVESLERLFTCIFSPHSCVKRVPDYRQYPRVKRHL